MLQTHHTLVICLDIVQKSQFFISQIFVSRFSQFSLNYSDPGCHGCSDAVKKIKTKMHELHFTVTVHLGSRGVAAVSGGGVGSHLA